MKQGNDSSYPGPFNSQWLGPRFWPVWLGVGLFRLISLLPGSLRRALGRWLGDLVWRRQPKRRAIIHTNLCWCFPEATEQQREQMERDYFRAMSQTLLDYGLLWWSSRHRLDQILTLEGEEHLQNVLNNGGKVILLTSHNVALDFGAAALTRFYPSVGLIKPARNPLIDWLMARGRTRFKGALFLRDKGMRPIVKGIKNGHAFYYLPDEDLGPEHSIFVPFFGVQTATLTALSKLSRMTGATVLPFATVYNAQTGHYNARIMPPLENFPSEDESVDAARMNLELEKMIAMAPTQYMWSMRIFQSRPDGSPPPYKMKGKPGSGHRERPME
jgi:lipid A biosynthesis (KDO)2-(lauroyl)-lipid IVA acyltransferase